MVEILVTIATLVVVLGLALGIMQESEHAAREIARQQAGAQFCQAALDEAVRTIRGAVAPGNFAGAGLGAPVFRKHELSLMAADAAAPGGFSRITLATEFDEKNHNPSGIVLRRGALGDKATTRTLALGGERPSRLHPLIRFAYAGPPPAPGQTDYQTEWTSPTLPALVRVTVEARLDGSVNSHSDIVLQTAVIPGLIPNEGPGARNQGSGAKGEGATAKPAAATKATPMPTPKAAPSKTPAPTPTATPSTRSNSSTPTPTPTPAPTLTPTPAANSKPVKNITAEPPRKVLKPDKLDEVKEVRPGT